MRTLAGLFTLCWVIAFQSGTADAATRSKSVERPDIGAKLLSAAEAETYLLPLRISEFDYNSVAPPGVSIRLIGNEPRVVLLGNARQTKQRVVQLISQVHLLSLLPTGGRMDLSIGVRLADTTTEGQKILDSFDDCVHNAYLRALVTSKRRGTREDWICEVHSPIGLLEVERDKHSEPLRELLSYEGYAQDSLFAGHSKVGLDTDFRHVQGQLAVVWRDRNAVRRVRMLFVVFEATEFPHCMAFVQNLARLVVNELNASSSNDVTALPYLSYSPNHEVLGSNDSIGNSHPLANGEFDFPSASLDESQDLLNGNERELAVDSSLQSAAGGLAIQCQSPASLIPPDRSRVAVSPGAKSSMHKATSDCLKRP
jgi:hypothetical protein